MQSKCKAMQSKCTRLVFVLILSNYLIINKTVVLFRYAVFTGSIAQVFIKISIQVHLKLNRANYKIAHKFIKRL